ncbi:MAG: hypothetical protein HUU37_00725, partial [Bdellovibrionales bacterium]|nr:hypothetical protein [Bdellovibrionales bacterium]
EYGSAQDRDLFRVEPAREILEAERLFAAELLELQTEVNRRGSRLLLAVLPTKMEREDPVARAPNFRPGRVAERVRAVAKSHGIAWADLSPLRREEGIFLADDYHLSAHGHERVAERLSVAIRGAKKSGAYD